MAKKPIKYPRKLRHTLEKVANTRVERENAIAKIDEEPNSFLTLWWEFLLPQQAHVMMMKLEGDDVQLAQMI